MFIRKQHGHSHSIRQRIENCEDYIKKIKSKRNQYTEEPPFKGSLQKRTYIIGTKVSETRKRILNKIEKLISVYKFERNVCRPCYFSKIASKNSTEMEQVSKSVSSLSASRALISKYIARKRSNPHLPLRSEERSLKMKYLNKIASRDHLTPLEPWIMESK